MTNKLTCTLSDQELIEKCEEHIKVLASKEDKGLSDTAMIMHFFELKSRFKTQNEHSFQL